MAISSLVDIVARLSPTPWSLSFSALAAIVPPRLLITSFYVLSQTKDPRPVFVISVVAFQATVNGVCNGPISCPWLRIGRSRLGTLTRPLFSLNLDWDLGSMGCVLVSCSPFLLLLLYLGLVRVPYLQLHCFLFAIFFIDNKNECF